MNATVRRRASPELPLLIERTCAALATLTAHIDEVDTVTHARVCDAVNIYLDALARRDGLMPADLRALFDGEILPDSAGCWRGQ